MKLYVCWGTFPVPTRPGGHPCANAHTALKDAGWEPEVIRTYGWAALPDFMNRTRRPVKELTGKSTVPVLELDDGTAIGGSKEIVAWAQANPAASPAAPTPA